LPSIARMRALESARSSSLRELVRDKNCEPVGHGAAR
jgi:hypothetical protein